MWRTYKNQCGQGGGECSDGGGTTGGGQSTGVFTGVFTHLVALDQMKLGVAEKVPQLLLLVERVEHIALDACEKRPTMLYESARIEYDGASVCATAHSGSRVFLTLDAHNRIRKAAGHMVILGGTLFTDHHNRLLHRVQGVDVIPAAAADNSSQRLAVSVNCRGNSGICYDFDTEVHICCIPKVDHNCVEVGRSHCQRFAETPRVAHLMSCESIRWVRMT